MKLNRNTLSLSIVFYKYRHEKSGVWFLQHIFHFSEGSSKLVGIFQKTQAGNVVFTTRTKAYFDNLCSGLMDSLN